MIFSLLVTSVVACTPQQLQIAPTMCMPFVSDGDGMKHDPAVNDTLEISRWLAAGGRGIDTAWSYDHGGYGRSQRQMGVAIAASKLPRADLFVTTKIPCGDNASAVAALIEYDLQQLMLPFVDLLLIHTPSNCKTAAALAETWAAIEGALAKKQVRAIGVSNFKQANLDALMKTAKVKPAVNQIAFSVGVLDSSTIAASAALGITVEAYSPLGHTGAPVMKNAVVVATAKALGKSAAQVALRYIYC